MSALRRGRNVLDPGPWLWVLGALVLPAMVLVGFGPATSGLIRPQATATDVSVVITHGQIQMPDSAFAGPIAFTVTNRDSVSHRLDIKAVGSEKPLTSVGPLTPGAKDEKQVTLGAGSYLVYCPKGQGDGLTHMLSVLTKPASSTGSR